MRPLAQMSIAILWICGTLAESGSSGTAGAVYTMKLMIRLGHIDPNEMGQDLVDELLSIYPQGRRGDGFWMVLPADDPLVGQVLDVLQRRGFKPWDRKKQRDRAKEYTLRTSNRMPL